MKFYMSELMNANALSKAEPLKAKDLTAAKREASRKQAFQDTVLEDYELDTTSLQDEDSYKGSDTEDAFKHSW